MTPSFCLIEIEINFNKIVSNYRIKALNYDGQKETIDLINGIPLI